MYALNAGLAITILQMSTANSVSNITDCFPVPRNYLTLNFCSSFLKSMKHSIICFGSMWAGACWASSVVLVNRGIVSDTFNPDFSISALTGISSKTM